MVHEFDHFIIDGQIITQNPTQTIMDKNKSVELYYKEVVYMSVKLTNSTTTPKTVDVKSTTTYTIPANGSIDITLKTGDEVILK